jgi:phosphoglycolate phosphatase-like HAD superfamily hydrolase
MKLTYYGLDHYFGGVGGFGDKVEDRALMIGEAIRMARRRAGKHATVFVIGDTIHDMTAAKANNVVAVGVTTGPASEEVLSKAGADIVLRTLESAADHLL